MSTATEPSAALWPYREACALLKQDIKNDVHSLRQQKQECRRSQRQDSPHAPAGQAALAHNRSWARARFIVYGFLRGRHWEQIERNHPDGEQRLKGLITNIWVSVQARLETPVEASPDLKPWLLR